LGGGRDAWECERESDREGEWVWSLHRMFASAELEVEDTTPHRHMFTDVGVFNLVYIKRGR